MQRGVNLTFISYSERGCRAREDEGETRDREGGHPDREAQRGSQPPLCAKAKVFTPTQARQGYPKYLRIYAYARSQAEQRRVHALCQAWLLK